MTTYVLDVETSTYSKGHPFSVCNKLVCVGLLDVLTGKHWIYYEEDFDKCKEQLSGKSISLVAFNAKFDLHWIRRAGLIPEFYRVWDCQLWEFLESCQQWRYPDLDSATSKRGLGNKLEVIEKEYWSKGIDTDQIPRPILSSYLQQDLELTAKLFKYQLTQERSWFNLFKAQCEDLIVLEEMEWNGILLDSEACENELKISKQKIESIEQELRKGYESIPINFDSNDHLSAYLYGGTIVVEDRVPIGFYKTGEKAGQVRNKVVEYKYELPQLCRPLKKFALKKEGYFSTGDDALRSIKTSKKTAKIISLLQERSKHQKLLSTYYEGIQKIIKEKDWSFNTIHGQFNQVVAATGRLSASSPNQQNFPPEMKQLLVSRYE